MDEVVTKLNILRDEFTHLHDYNPIENVSSRLKSPESLVEKIGRKGIDARRPRVVRRGPRPGHRHRRRPRRVQLRLRRLPRLRPARPAAGRDDRRGPRLHQASPSPTATGACTRWWRCRSSCRAGRCRSSSRCSSAPSRWTSGRASSTRSTTSTAATCPPSCSTACTTRPRRRTRSTRPWSGCTRRSAGSTTCRPSSCTRCRAATGRTPRWSPRCAGSALSAELELPDDLVARPAARTFAEVRRHQLDPVDPPRRAGVRVEEPHPVRDLRRAAEPGQGDVRAEPLPVDRDAGPAGGRPAAGREPVELGAPGVVEVEPGPEHPGAAGVREGAAAGDPGLEGRTPGCGSREPLGEVVEPAFLHLGQEGERDVELVAGSPSGTAPPTARRRGTRRGARRPPRGGTSAAKRRTSADLGAQQRSRSRR